MAGMNPTPPPPASRRTGFLAGFASGFGLALVIGLAAAFLGYQSARKEARRGWNLVPAVTAAVDLPEGTEITYELLAQRQIPEQFLTASVVKPDAVNYILKQKVLVPLRAGDPLLWTQFDTALRPASRPLKAVDNR